MDDKKQLALYTLKTLVKDRRALLFKRLTVFKQIKQLQLEKNKINEGLREIDMRVDFNLREMRPKKESGD